MTINFKKLLTSLRLTCGNPVAEINRAEEIFALPGTFSIILPMLMLFGIASNVFARRACKSSSAVVSSCVCLFTVNRF